MDINNKPYVFISYAKEDFKLADKLYTYLKENLIIAWMDYHSLVPGQNWKVEINKAIKKCSAFIILLSNTAVDKRGFIQKELRTAVDVLDEIPASSIYLIPARLDNCTPSHERLEDLHWVDLFPDFDAGFDKILNALIIGEICPKEDKKHVRQKKRKSDISDIEIAVIDELRNKPDVNWTHSDIENSLKINRSEELWIDQDIRTAITAMIERGYLKLDQNGRIIVTYKSIDYYRKNPRKY